MVELGRVDICLEVSMMSYHMDMPREGHFNKNSTYCSPKKYHNTDIVYDSSNPVIDESKYQQQNWTSIEFGYLQGKK